MYTTRISNRYLTYGNVDNKEPYNQLRNQQQTIKQTNKQKILEIQMNGLWLVSDKLFWKTVRPQ